MFRQDKVSLPVHDNAGYAVDEEFGQCSITASLESVHVSHSSDARQHVSTILARIETGTNME